MGMNGLSLFLLAGTLLLAGCSTETSGKDSKPEEGAKATLETYNYPSGVSKSRKYFVSVDGVAQTVYPTDEAHICTFGCDGEVSVSVTLMSEVVKEAALRPLGKNYSYEITDAQTILFKVKPGDRVVAEFNGIEQGQLFIFANPLSEKPAQTEGLLLFEAGKTYNDSYIRLTDNQTIYLEGGSVLKAKICADNAKNVKILGYGILDTWGNDADISSIRFLGTDGAQVDGPVILGDGGRVFFNAMSSNVTVNNTKIIGRVGGVQCDALDLYGCHDYKITSCFAYGNDDTYCIKTWKWSYKGESYNISFEDCIARNTRGNSFEIGYETGLDIHNITYKDIYSIHSSGGADNTMRRGAVTIHNGSAGHIYDIRYEGVHIEDPLEFGIDMRILKSSYELGAGETWAPGIIDKVYLKDVKMYRQAPQGNTLKGYDSSHKISVEFENLEIAGKKISSAAEGNFAVSNASASFK
ncbi:MAG: glycosyl hydrolase family 28 protein [Candidatus Cryptobacteroides sp.]|nr:glycosyl hydrolase family 28 protein [Candidatus Cryptobacteroides sp.]